MADILESLQGGDVQRFEAGRTLIRQGDRTGRLFFLIEETVEVFKDDVRVASTSQAGVVFGEMAAILGVEHTATVKTAGVGTFYVVENSDEFLKTSPEMSHYLCSLLARRLDSVNSYLVEVRRRSDGNEHLDTVIGALEAPLHAQPARGRGGKRADR
jgi:CRP-like cAMP-binding protein